jgi:hypothetical protein
MRLHEISDFSDTSNIHVDRPHSISSRIPTGKTSGIVDEMSQELEHIVDRWVKVDWEDPKLDPESKARFSNAVTELLDIMQGVDI